LDLREIKNRNYIIFSFVICLHRIISEIESRTRWVGHVACMGTKMLIIFGLDKLKGGDHS